MRRVVSAIEMNFVSSTRSDLDIFFDTIAELLLKQPKGKKSYEIYIQTPYDEYKYNEIKKAYLNAGWTIVNVSFEQRDDKPYGTWINLTK